VSEGYDVGEARPSQTDEVTDRHPWLAALTLGLVVFALVYALEAAVRSANAPTTDAALAGALVALTMGIVWRRDVDD
jgi:hypothetical protein